MWPTASQPWDTDGLRDPSAPVGAASGGRLAKNIAPASSDLRPDVAPGGAQHSFCDVLSHGWLAVGHMMSPAKAGF
jgi:hypothetical protein